MERELGISYPTVRGRVDALVRALGLADGAQLEDSPDVGADADAAAAADVNAERRSILERLARKELDAEEAAAALRALGPGS
jgi:hypothetical protein